MDKENIEDMKDVLEIVLLALSGGILFLPLIDKKV